MNSSEEYLDSLLKAALNGEQNTDVVSEIEQAGEPQISDIAEEPVSEIVGVLPEEIIEDEENVTEEPLDELVENLPETPVSDMSDDPNRALSADEIAALFGQMETSGATEEVAEESPEEVEEESPEEVEEENPEKVEEEPAEEPVENVSEVPEEVIPPEDNGEQEEYDSIDSLLAKESQGEPLEIDLEDDDVLEMLLGSKEESDEDDAANQSNEEDLDGLLAGLVGENEDLQEINDLLQKLDSDELVLDDLETATFTGPADDVNSTEEQQAEGSKKSKKIKNKKEKKEKKGFSLFKKKEKAIKEETDERPEGAEEESIEIAKDSLPEEFVSELGLDGLDADAVSELLNGEGEKEKGRKKKDKKEKSKKETDKKDGFLSKMFEALTEEIPEEEEQQRKEQNSEESGKKTKKDKKGKKGKRASVTDAADNEGILAELDAEEDSKKTKGKKKSGKPKKEKAGKEKKKKESPAFDANEKKLPTKMVVRIFVLSLSIMAFVLVVTFIVPRAWSLADARNAFYKQDYENAYMEMAGRNLSDSDQRLYEKTKMILQLSHKYEAYESYKEMGLDVKALDSLLSGYRIWEQLQEKIAEYDAVTETDAVKAQIIDALGAEYQLSEEDAQAINAMDDYNYTVELEKITGSNAQQKPGSRTEDSEKLSKNGEEESKVESTDMNSDTEETSVPAEDVLSEEEIK